MKKGPDRALLYALERSIRGRRTAAIAGAGLPAALHWPTGSQLLDEVRQELSRHGVEREPKDFAQAVDELDQLRGRAYVRRFLRDVLRKQAGVESCDARHAEIARAFPYVVTTNWDCTFDIVYMSHMDCYNIIPCICPTGPSEQSPPDWSVGADGASHHLIKLHGTIALPYSMIASETDVKRLATMTTDTAASPFARWLQQILRDNQVFIIGYGFDDIDVVVPYLAALRTKTATEPDYFVYHQYDKPGPRARVEAKLKQVWGNVRLFPGTMDEFFEALSQIDIDSPSLAREPRRTRWGVPPRGPDVVGHEEAAGRVKTFLAQPSETLCVVASHPHAGASTFASHVLRMAAEIVGAERVCWIEFKDYLPLSVYRAFVEDYLRSRAAARGDISGTPWPGSENSAVKAADRVGDLVAATRGRTVFVMEQFHQSTSQPEVVSFFVRLMADVSRRVPVGRVQFIAFVPLSARGVLPGAFSQLLGEEHAACPTVDVTLGHVLPDRLLAMLRRRLSFRLSKACNNLAKGFASSFTIGTAVPATVLLTSRGKITKRVKTTKDVRKLLDGVPARRRLDTLFGCIVDAIREQDPRLYEFMLRCSVFRTARDENALRAAWPEHGPDPVGMAKRLVKHGIFAEGQAGASGEVSYVMPSSVRRFLASRPETRGGWREWNRSAAEHYVEQACAPAVSREEALELLAAAFYHSREAGDFDRFLLGLRERRRDLIGTWNLPVIEDWLAEISKTWREPTLEQRVGLLLLRLRVARNRADPRDLRKVCNDGEELVINRSGFGEAFSQFRAGIGVAYWFERKYDIALGKFREARDIARQAGAAGLVVQLTLRMARCLVALARPREAWSELNAVENQLEQLKDVLGQEHHRAVYLSHCAELARLSEQYEEAGRWADECLRLSLHQLWPFGADRIGCAIAYLIKAQVALSQGWPEQAIGAAREALIQLHEPPSSAWWTSVSFLTLAEALAKSGRNDEAESALEGAQGISPSLSSARQPLRPWSSLEVSYIRGLIALNRQNFGEAVDLLSQAAEGWRNTADFLRCGPELLAAVLRGRQREVRLQPEQIMEEIRNLRLRFQDAYAQQWPSA